MKTLAVDAQGKPLYSTDAKGAEVYTAYDALNRPTDIWARDAAAEAVTLRQHMVYGDAAHPDPLPGNHLGKLWKHYDEAGLATITAYDFKGNPLSKTRQVIVDAELLGAEKYVVDWDGLNSALLDAREYITQLFYDGLNRVRLSILPEEVSDGPINDLPKELIPTYNRAGALQSIAFAGTEHVRHIAYNAKGQRVLMAMGNSMMTRYAYDPITFRLQRIKTEKYTEASGTYTPQSGTTKQDTAYVYDLGGNIITIKERVSDCGIVGTALGANALDKLFTYDPLKRLLTATGRESSTTSANHLWDDTPVNSDLSATRAYTQHFEYDKLGNILLLDHDATGNNYNRYYRYTGGKNLLEQIDNDGSPAEVYSTFEYDANGNLISSNADREYEWDAADQLKYFKIDDGTTITKQAHYLYAGGQRVKKVVRTGNALEVTVYIDGVYEHRYKALVGISTLSPQHQNNYFVMDGRSRIATVRLGHAWGDTSPDLCYNLEDHLGTSTTRLTDDGTIIDREEYYPFGESSLRTFEKKRYRYVGKELDSESGLYYYGARYYAAWTCRFVSVDPLAGKYPMLSPYNYASNSPIGQLDVDGMQNPEQPTAPSGGGNAEFDKVASAFAEEHRGGSCAIQTYSDGNTFLGMLASDTETIFYDSRHPAKFAMHTGNFAGSAFVDENAMKWQVAVHYIDSNERLHPGFADPFEPYAVQLIEGTKGEVAMVGFFTYLATRNGVTMGAPDSTTTPDVLFDEWVFGGGSDVHVFDEQSAMGQGMLETNYVRDEMEAAAIRAQAGDRSPGTIERNAGDENELAYAITTIYEGTIGNAVRAFHGSIRGTVSVTDLFEVEGQQYAMMRVVLWDRMGAESGTRYPPILNGYSGEGPRSVLPNEPFATDGMFRTKLVYYDMNVLYPIPK